MVSTSRSPHLVALYAVLVLLLVIGGLLAVGGQPLQALLVLGIATLLNARMLALRKRLLRRTEGGPDRRPATPPEK
jgi:formate hydrogenlyase subunit 3/multisubunit Na+/H+ antiporter MnhD subunit